MFWLMFNYPHLSKGLYIYPFFQDYEIRIKNLQEEVERHSMMSSIITVSDLTSELEQVEGRYKRGS